MRRKSKRTRQLPKYLKKQIERANKKIKSWLDAGLSSNELRMAQKFLKDFYKANKKKFTYKQFAGHKRFQTDNCVRIVL